ncbi:MAG: Na+/H+ antiporter subunit E [Acidimicrobiales bacterium]|nr:Na+/H+ antiporter subunit E [Acidimicrobiales bacterium]
MTQVLRLGVLVTVWLMLWSDLSWANLVSGFVVAGAIATLFPAWNRGILAIRPLAFAKFAIYFLYKLVQASLVVAVTVVVPHKRVRRGIIAVPLQGCSDAVATLVADAISLTPGTLTLEVRREPLTLYVHALDTRDVTQVQREVRTLELLAVRAFGDADAIAGLAVDDITSWRAE